MSKPEKLALTDRRRLDVQRLRALALPVIAEKGIEAVTADELSAVLEISRRTFFRYFPAKEDVVVGGLADLGTVIRWALEREDQQEAFGLARIQSVLSLALRSHEFFTPVGRRQFRLVMQTAALRARFLGQLEQAAEGLIQMANQRGLTGGEASLSVRLTITIMVEAMERWSQGDTDDIGAQVASVCAETAALVA